MGFVCSNAKHGVQIKERIVLCILQINIGDKDGVECWHCTIKRCKARIETLNSDVVSDIGLHSHDDKVNNLSYDYFVRFRV